MLEDWDIRASGNQEAGYYLKINANCKINNAKLAII
jgi:hypothetical protein